MLRAVSLYLPSPTIFLPKFLICFLFLSEQYQIALLTHQQLRVLQLLRYPRVHRDPHLLCLLFLVLRQRDGLREITVSACCLQAWTEPKSPCGSAPIACSRGTRHNFFMFPDYFKGGRKAALDEFNTLGTGSKTIICCLLTVWPTANAVTPKFSTCRRRICDSFLIHVKKCMVGLYCLASSLNRGKKTGILKHDSSLSFSWLL